MSIDTRPDDHASTTPGPATTPSPSDGLVRRSSEVIGGRGDHALHSTGPPVGESVLDGRRIVLALACLTLALHWVQKAPCQNGAWQNNVRYTRMCYTDVLALFSPRACTRARSPTGTTRWIPGAHRLHDGRARLPVHAVGVDDPTIDQGR